MTTKPTANSELVDNFKVAYFPAESLKNYIKRDESLFTTFKEGKCWETWRRKTLYTARAHDIAKVLKPNYHPVTYDDVIFFREK